MDIKVSEVNIQIDTSSINEVLILPVRFEDDQDSKDYLSSSISFYKLLQKKLPVKLYSEPECLIDLRESTWIAPAVFFAYNLISENPDALKILIESVFDSVKKHVLSEDKSTVELNIYHESSKGTLRKIEYKGPKESLGEVGEIIRSVMNEE